MIYIISILIKPFSKPLCPVDGGRVILEDINWILICHHRTKVISQNLCGTRVNPHQARKINKGIPLGTLGFLFQSKGMLLASSNPV